eukprot:COSAG02_NODE_15961_length_1125_cov_1.869396_2_plen_201_part_00
MRCFAGHSFLHANGHSNSVRWSSPSRTRVSRANLDGALCGNKQSGPYAWARVRLQTTTMPRGGNAPRESDRHGTRWRRWAPPLSWLHLVARISSCILNRSSQDTQLYIAHQAVRTLFSAHIANESQALGNASAMMKSPCALTQLSTAFMNTWADNADALAMAYVGTPALKTDFTRTGKRTLRGAAMDGWHSFYRYFLGEC